MFEARWESRSWSKLGRGGRIVIGSFNDDEVPPDTESRLEQFTELMATAIANADSRDQLRASRARLVTAADEARRRTERDLHDGVQQQLVALSLRLVAMGADPRVGEADELRTELAEAADDVNAALETLVEIARGIHPATLAHGGLKPALKSLVGRSPIPVELGVRIEEPLPTPVELAGYYVVSEALTNVAKHARATVVRIDATADSDSLGLVVMDDGIGGAELGKGSGLVGLQDRVEALGGTISIDSPPGRGTTLAVALPIVTDPRAATASAGPPRRSSRC